MKGVILAGGLGTRLRPLTYISNKHLLPVYNKPMIDYPIQTLKDMGCDDIIIVSGGEHIGRFAEYLGGSYTYRVQDKAGGIAQALGCVRGLVKGVFPVILGDNYFSKAPEMPKEPTLYITPTKEPWRFGIYNFDTHQIVEKPTSDYGQYAVTGLYVYDDRVFDFIDTLKPSDRGELEITDVNNYYLDQGYAPKLYNGFWSDMGTFDSLLSVANHLGEQNG